MQTNEELLTAAEVAAYFRNAISTRTMANWRSTKQGPPYVKVGGRVLYPRQGVLDWEARRTRKHG